MYWILIRHQWLSAIRSRMWQKKLITNILIGFFLVYMLFNFFLAGYFLGDFLQELFPGEDIFRVFCSGLLFYFGLDLFMRFTIQDIPVLSIEPYLHLPIRKSTLVRYMLTRSLISFFNLAPVFILLPFIIRTVAPAFGTAIALQWFFSLWLLVFADNFIILYLKKLVVDKPWIIVALGILLAVLIAAQYFGWINTAAVSVYLFTHYLHSPLWLILPVALIALFYRINYQYLLQRVYPEEIGRRKKNKSVSTANLTFLNKLGQLGDYISLDIKLIWRHRRSRASLIMAAVFVAYGLVFYSNKKLSGGGIFIFPGILLTGMFLLNYGQFLISWYGNYFDAIMANNIRLKQWLLARYYLICCICAGAYIISIPYWFLSPQIVYINLACLIYNLGVNSYIVFFFSLINPAKIDLNKRTNNYKTMSGSRLIMSLPVMILPIILYLSFKVFWGEKAGLLALAGAGIVGFLFRGNFMGRFAGMLQLKKYEISESFREGEE